MKFLSVLLAVFLVLFGLVEFPSAGTVLFFLAAAAVLPLAPIRNLWKKIPIKGGWLKPVAVAAIFCVACGLSPTSTTENTETQTTSAENAEDITVDMQAEDARDDVIATTAEKEEKQAVKTADQAETGEEKEETVFTAELFDVGAVPAYSGEAYTAVNDNVPYFTDADLQQASVSYESYSDLDSLGRCGVCVASVGPDIMPTEERGEIGQVKPTGWQTVKYNGIVDGNYLYNRCHLIGYQLTGENANEKNLITGTRYMNTEGMLPFENMVADYVKATEDHVLYRVTPIFEGNNLVASGVLMEAESVEDSGEGILFNVYVYNVQPGISIEYASGKSEPDGTVAPVAAETEKKTEEKAETSNNKQTQEQETAQQPEQPQQEEAVWQQEPDQQPETAQQPEQPQQEEIVQQQEQIQEQAAIPQPATEGTSYVLNTNTKKFHYTWCSSVDQMKPKNREDFTGSRDDVIARGYVPCKRCNP